MASNRRPLVNYLPAAVKAQPFEFMLSTSALLAGIMAILTGGLLATSLRAQGGWAQMLMLLWDVTYCLAAVMILVALIWPTLPMASAFERGGLILLSTCALVYALSVVFSPVLYGISLYVVLMQLGLGAASFIRSAQIAEVDRILLDTLREANSRHEGNKGNGDQ